jgi:signal transduction histidine kinase/heme-degrading monooxygenase HmoA
MILAVSRFRVANNREGAVREAFLERPHLVDTAPGFLGMEVFNDSSDSTIFCLITRWTDQKSFHAWHRGEAHRASHQGIPKGLKLDPAYTKVMVLDRISDAGSPPALDEMAADSAQLLAQFLSKTAAVHYLAVGLDGVIHACNSAVGEGLNLEPSQLLGQSLWDFLPPTDSARLRQRVDSGERNLAEPLVLSFTDGTRALYTLKCHIDVQPDGLVLIGEPPQREERLLREQLFQISSELAVQARERAQLLAREQTARRAAEASRQEAERANRSKDDFLGFVSHELRSPLSAILSWSELLLTHKDDPTIVLRGIETIRRNAQLQAKLVEDLLDISRIVAGKLDLTMAPVELLPLLNGAVETIRPMADERGLRLTSALDPWLGRVSGDAMRLQQLFSNLLVNAVKFTPPGGSVELRARGDKERVVVAVTDTGQGIRPEFLPHVFERFAQEETGTSARRHGGLGLGLSIVRHLVEAHGGSVAAHSDGEGLGAAFTVTLPILRDDQRISPIPPP